MSNYQMPNKEAVRKVSSGENKRMSSPAIIPLGDHNLNYFEIPFDKNTRGIKKKLVIIPYVVTDAHHPDNIPQGYLWSRRQTEIHAKMGLVGENILCPRSIGKKCPICDYYWKLWHNGEADSDVAKAIKSRRRDLYHIIDVEEDKDTVLLWDVSIGNFSKELDETIALNTGDELYEGFFDPTNGALLNVLFVVDEFGKSKFIRAKSIEFVPRKRDYSEYIKQTISLDDHIKVLSAIELVNLLKETISIINNEESYEAYENKALEATAKEKSRYGLDPDDEMPSFDIPKDRKTKNDVPPFDMEEAEAETEADPKSKAKKQTKATDKYDIDLDDASDAEY